MAPGRRLRAALVGLRYDPAYRYLLAPAYLKAYADSRPEVAARWDVRVHQRRAQEDAAAVAEAVLRDRPDLVGLSVYVWNVEAVGRLAAELKRRRPGLTVVVGGPEAGPQAEAVLASWRAVDLVCTGEGEAAFADLLARLADG
ncbi:MAG: cobalamin-dependent protein, partial [Elusimicrobia bacterium]|nr:cobalamin-dependent protein [Elusimicrobiota bacterium]